MNTQINQINPTTARPRAVLRTAGTIAVMALTFAACSSSDDSSGDSNAAPVDTEAPSIDAPTTDAPTTDAPTTDGPAAATGSAEVTIESFEYNPTPIEVAAGTEITWTNVDSFSHTVTNDGGDFEFDSGNFSDGETFSLTFDTPGEYAYLCTIHTQMKATVVVT